MILVRSIAFIIQNFFFICIGLLGINFVVGFHELGHFLFAKLFNIRTPSFSVGFGPALIQKKIRGTNFMFSAIPLGGFVEIAGMAEVGQGEQKDAKATDTHSFNAKPYYQKLLVLLGGILFNLLFAYFALVLLFMMGLPKSEMLYPRSASTVIADIEKDSPAAGKLQIGDTLLAINNIPLNGEATTALRIINEHPNEEISLQIKRNNAVSTTELTEGQKEISEGSPEEFLQEINVPVTTGSKTFQDNPVGYLGITFEITGTAGLPFTQALMQGVALANKFVVATFHSVKNIFTKRDMSKMGGPILVISETVKGAGHSFGVFLFMLALISINLAILNLIPVPILDGGQVVYYTIEAIIGRPLPLKVREYIHIGSWILMLGLILYMSTQDIYRLIKPFISKFTQ